MFIKPFNILALHHVMKIVRPAGELPRCKNTSVIRRRTYRIVDLSLVELQLLMQLIDDVVHSFVCGPILLQLCGQLLESALLASHRFSRLGVALLFALELHLQLVDALQQMKTFSRRKSVTSFEH